MATVRLTVQSAFEDAGTAAAAKGLAAVAAGYAAVVAAAAFAIRDTVKLADEMTNLSERTGLSTTALQKFKLAGDLVGVGVDSVAKGALKLQKAVAEGSDTTTKAVNALGLSMKQLQNATPDKQLETVLGALKDVGNQSEKTAIAMALLGKAGAELGPLADALEKVSGLTGAIIAPEDIQAADDFGDSLATLWNEVKAVANQFGAAVLQSQPLHALIEGLIHVFDNLALTMKANGAGIRTFVDAGVLLLAKGFVALVDAVQLGFNVWDALRLTWLSLTAGATDLALAFARASLAAQKWGGSQEDVALAQQRVASLEKEKAAIEAQASAVVKSGAAWADGLGKVRGELVKVQGAVEAAMGQVHTSTAAATKTVGEFTGGLTKAGDEAKKLAKILDENAQAMYKLGQKNTADLWKNIAVGLKLPGGNGAVDWGKFFPKREVIDPVEQGIKRAEKEAAHFSQRLQDVRNAFELLGISADSALSKIVGGFLAGKVAGNQMQASILKGDKLGAGLTALTSAAAVYKSGSILGGAATGAAIGSVIPGLGTAAGAIVGGLVGLAGKLFGSKWKKVASEAGKILGHGISEDMAKQIQAEAKQTGKSVTDILKGMAKTEAFQKALGLQQERGEGADRITSSLGFVGKLAGAASAQGQIFTADFWAVFAEKGPGAAVDAFKASFEELKKIAPEAAAPLEQVFAAFSEGPARDAADAAQALAGNLAGLAKSGYLTAESFAAFGQTAQAAFQQAQDGGATTQQALLAVAPLLANIERIQQETGLQVDATTQALIDQAHAAGIAFPVDPMLEVLNVLKDILAALGGVAGQARAAGNAIAGIPPPPQFGGGGGGGEPGGGGGERERGSYDLGTDFVPATGLYRLHKGEAVRTAAENRRGGDGGNVLHFSPRVTIGAGADKAAVDYAMARLERMFRNNQGNLVNAVKKRGKR